jgi:hypothetical protein
MVPTQGVAEDTPQNEQDLAPFVVARSRLTADMFPISFYMSIYWSKFQ